ncbi:mechanosensitive ion channel domain-containing protein [Saccharospirillum mangrovi]|uniref:mechanosensitive ion channel domain-containing protein n=1 Tax=Saccharospirillum mangrovi TaxID=2161747 RepID=UPI000D346714|nr:mechanosensitive ion channel domain-containing protein [Saccharospirillum mangrovi]
MEWRLLLALAVLAIAFFLTRSLLSYFLTIFVDSKDVSIQRKALVRKTLHFFHVLAYGVATGLVFGISYGQFVLFLSSFIAVLGVALFAQWSILSNVTASVIIFFQFPFRIGDEIRIVFKDEDLSGVIEEITPFHTLIRRRQGDLLTYPNSLLLQTAVIKPLPQAVAASETPSVKATAEPAERQPIEAGQQQ